MEIWDERIRLQDARQRVERLQKAFEPTHLSVPRRERPLPRRGHRPVLHRRHVPVH